MNCQDVNEILDQMRLDQLDSERRQKVESHAASCPDCARAWNAQSALAALPDEPMPAGLTRQCLAAVAGHGPDATRSRRQAHRRLLVWGSVTGVAAAAAALLLLLHVETRIAPVETAPAARAETAHQVDEVATVQTNVAATSTPHLVETAGPGAVMGPRITVQVSEGESVQDGQEPLQATAADPYAREVRQSLRTALVAELRKVPSLEVVQQVPGQLLAPARHYRLRIHPLRLMGVDGRPIRREHLYDLNLSVQEIKSGGSTVQHSMPLAVSVDPLATCTAPDDPRTRSCDAATTAAFLVRMLREKIFPPDPSVIRPLQARLQDFSLPPDERFRAFVDLFKLQANTGGNDLLGDPQVVRAAIELSQLTDAPHRAQLWRALRGIGNADLIDPMLASLQQDPRDARIAAVETLALDFSGDPGVRSALQSAAVSDPDSLVRGLALRGLNGEGAWQAHVMSSLKQATLPPSQRVEALLHMLYPPDRIAGISDGSPASYWQTLRDLDDAAVEALAEVFPKAEQLRKWPANNLVGNFAGTHNQNPAVRKMLLTVLESDTHALNRSVAGEALAQSHVSDPQVRQALTRAASTDPDASVRDYLRQVLDRDYVKKAMEAAAR